MTVTEQQDYFKSATKELADLFTHSEVLRAFRMVSHLSSPRQIDSAEAFRKIATDPLPPLDGSHPVRIGIWELAEPGENPAYERRSNNDPPHMVWSPADCIPPKRLNRKRVVLVGESVARGHFQDPYFNPATALQLMLSSGLGEDVEVVDLARTGVLMQEALTFVKSAQLLKPDAIVVFAGNNWHPSWFLQRDSLFEIGLRLRKLNDWTQFKVILSDILLHHLRLFSESIKLMIQSSGIPVIFMIPEFNLADWRHRTTPHPLLEPSQITRWLDLQSEAQQALEHKDADRIISYSKEMLKIDHGSVPATFYFLADASHILGDSKSAKQYLRDSCDSALYWPGSFTPGIMSPIRDFLLKTGKTHGFETVDLQSILENYLHGGLPGRQIFHDYCHLTVEGTRLCMAHAAERLLPLLGGGECSWERLASVNLEVREEILVGSHLTAAAFNAHHMQSVDVVRHHLSEALRSGQIAVKMLSLFADFYIRRTPAMMCDSLEGFLNITHLACYLLLIGFGRQGRRTGNKPLDINLICEIKRALADVDPGFVNSIDNLLVEEHGVSLRNVNLLERAYAPNSFPHTLRQSIEYFQGVEPSSTFILICEKPCPIKVNITYRAGKTDSPKDITAAVNNLPLATFSASPNWKTESFVIPEERIRTGVNTIVISWPEPDWGQRNWIDETATLLEAGVSPPFRPVFGEIYDFNATAIESESARLLQHK